VSDHRLPVEGSLSPSEKTLILFVIWIIISWRNLSSDMNTVTNGKYRYSIRSSVILIFCGKKKKL